MYGEKIDIYSGTDPIQKEFMKAGLDYLQAIDDIGRALPLYRIYPTKEYRDFKKVMNRMRNVGESIKQLFYTQYHT